MVLFELYGTYHVNNSGKENMNVYIYKYNVFPLVNSIHVTRILFTKIQTH